MPTQQPAHRDKRLPDSNVYTDINELRWNFLFGGLFVPERPIDPLDQPTMTNEETPDLSEDEDTTEDGPENGSQNIDDPGDTSGPGDVNPDLDDPSGESDFDTDDDTDSEPDHDSADNDGDEFGDSDFEAEAEGEAERNAEDSEQSDSDEPEPKETDPDDFGYDKPTNNERNLPAYEVTVNADGTKNHIRSFDSWMEFVQCASDMTLRGWAYATVSDTKAELDDPYYATETLDQAIDMALWSGWPEGRDMLIDSMAQVMPKNEYRVHHELDVAGAFPIVPVYCAGDPACMMSIETELLHATRPIVRIDYNNVCSFNIDAPAMMKMGAAVLSFAQTLEMAGYSTELRIVGNMKSKKDTFRYNVVYKRAGEPLDLDRAAFAIAHPSTMRRFALGLMEQHPDLQHFGHAGHGYPLREPNDPTSGQPNGAIFIPPAGKNYTSISECKAIVESAASDLITKLQLSLAA